MEQCCILEIEKNIYVRQYFPFEAQLSMLSEIESVSKQYIFLIYFYHAKIINFLHISRVSPR